MKRKGGLRRKTGVENGFKRRLSCRKNEAKKNRKMDRKAIGIAINFACLAVLWVVFSILAVQVIFGLFFALLPSEWLESPIFSGIYSILVYGTVIILTVYALPRFAKKLKFKETWQTSREEMGLRGLPTWTDLGLSAVGYVVSTLLAAGLTYLFSFFSWFDAGQAQETGFSIYMNSGEKNIAFITLVVVAPIVEEVIFRGWLYGKLRSKMGVIAAMLVTSVVFGVMHFQWNVGVNVFALSVVLCGLREITGTIYAGILTHMIKNGVAFFLLYIIGV